MRTVRAGALTNTARQAGKCAAAAGGCAEADGPATNIHPAHVAELARPAELLVQSRKNDSKCAALSCCGALASVIIQDHILGVK